MRTVLTKSKDRYIMTEYWDDNNSSRDIIGEVGKIWPSGQILPTICFVNKVFWEHNHFLNKSFVAAFMLICTVGSLQKCLQTPITEEQVMIEYLQNFTQKLELTDFIKTGCRMGVIHVGSIFWDLWPEYPEWSVQNFIWAQKELAPHPNKHRGLWYANDKFAGFT